MDEYRLWSLSANCCKYVLLFCLSLCVVSEVQEHQREEKETNQHRERAHVVRVGGVNEPFVLRVLERAHRHLGGTEEVCIANTIIIYLELEHTVHVG